MGVEAGGTQEHQSRVQAGVGFRAGDSEPHPWLAVGESLGVGGPSWD